MNYQAQTAVVANMLSDWNTESNLQEAVILLGLTEWVAALQQVNTEFNKHFVARISEMAVNPVTSFYSLRTDAKMTYRALVAYVNAYKTLNTDEAYASIYHNIYELARQYNQVVKVRSKALSRK